MGKSYLLETFRLASMTRAWATCSLASAMLNRRVIEDHRETGRSKSFGFVEMASPTEAQAAIDGLNGTDQGGRALNVSGKTSEPRNDWWLQQPPLLDTNRI